MFMRLQGQLDCLPTLQISLLLKNRHSAKAEGEVSHSAGLRALIYLIGKLLDKSFSSVISEVYLLQGILSEQGLSATEPLNLLRNIIVLQKILEKLLCFS